MDGGSEKAADRPPSADRVIVLGLVAGAFWASLVTEVIEARVYRRDAASLVGPDWDARGRGLGASPWVGQRTPVPYPRALRQARGVGRRRSLDLTRYFQAHGKGAPPEGLYGVGKSTAAAVADVLKGLGIGPSPPALLVDPGDRSEPSGARVEDG